MSEPWKEKTLAESVKITKGITYASSDYASEDRGHVFLTIKCFAKGGGFNIDGVKYFKGLFTSEQEVLPGELLVAKTDLTRDGDIIGSPMLAPDFGKGRKILPSMDLCILRPINSETNLRFLFYRLMLGDARRFMWAHSAGSTVLHLESKALPKFSFYAPSPTEQNQISKILSTVDNSIEQTNKLIGKYEQIKAGLMQDLITCGIDSNGKLRSSPEEVPQLYKNTPAGYVPKAWEYKQFSSLYLEPSKNGLYKPSTSYGSGSPMVHMPQMFRSLTVDLSDAVRVQVGPSELVRFGLEEADLLFARRSLTLEGAGRCSLVPKLQEPTTFESSIIRVRLDQKVAVPEFINFYLSSAHFYRFRLRIIRQVAVSGVTGPDLAKLPIMLPSIDEQNQAVERLKACERQIENEKSKKEKLFKLKAGLMNDLLRGCVPVKITEKVVA